MLQEGGGISRLAIDRHGLANAATVDWILTPAALEHAVWRGEGAIVEDGALVTGPGSHTGRAAKDRFIVREASTADQVASSKVNVPFEEANFDALLKRVLAYLHGRDLFVRDCCVGASPSYRRKTVLSRRTPWGDGAAHDHKARELAGRFRASFKAFAAQVSADVRATAPQAG